jgi:antitoxin CcdA
MSKLGSVTRASIHRADNGAKRPTNVSLSRRLLEEAREHGINISQACERGLAEQVAESRAAKWLEENGAAIQSSNTYVEGHGVPLARHRRF